MILRDELTANLNEYLAVHEFSDYGPNGLQVEGKEKVEKIITAVSANVELFDLAIEKKADMIIVHHGIIWSKESPVVKGGLKARLKRLLDNEITLLAYHLPLDKHMQVGNNAQAAKNLQLRDIEGFIDVGVKGVMDPIPFTSFLENVKSYYGSNPLVFDYGPKTVSRIGICSGGSQYYISQAIEDGLDVFITGEVSEPVMHKAKEGNIHFIAAGHYATERPGIMALGDYIAAQFDVDVKYIDVHNPV